ncbi:MAG: PQQ-dependent sugar dehydrogenase, partial [Rhodobacterales bacterium]
MHKNFTLHYPAALLLIVFSLMLSYAYKSNASDKNSSTGNSSSADNFTGICKVTGTIAAIPDVTAQAIVTSLSEPVHVTNASDGSGRLFIVEKRGTVQILLNGMIQSNTYLDISNLVKNSGEMGLLSMAFHPEYSTNGKFYVNYVSDSSVSNQCTQSNRCTIISEFTENKTIKLEDSERILMEIEQPYSNHNGGQIAFGLEDNPYLYIGMGDGGYGDDPEDNSQDLTNLLGAILRI